MLRVVVELWPARGGLPKILHEVRIGNVTKEGKYTDDIGDYEVRSVPTEAEKLHAFHASVSEGKEVRIGEAKVTGYHRSRGALELSWRALGALLGRKIR